MTKMGSGKKNESADVASGLRVRTGVSAMVRIRVWIGLGLVIGLGGGFD